MINADYFRNYGNRWKGLDALVDKIASISPEKVWSDELMRTALEQVRGWAANSKGPADAELLKGQLNELIAVIAMDRGNGTSASLPSSYATVAEAMLSCVEAAEYLEAGDVEEFGNCAATAFETISELEAQ